MLNVAKGAPSEPNPPPLKKQKTPKPEQRTSPRTKQKQAEKQAELSVEEREKRAAEYVRLRELKKPGELKTFLQKPENVRGKGRRQLLKDTKRLEGGGCIQKVGRPAVFGGEEGIAHVQKKLRKLASENADRSQKVVHELMGEAQAQSAAKRNAFQPFKQPSRTTVWRFKKQAVKRGSAHTKTSARTVSEESLRNFISYASMLGAAHEMSNPSGAAEPALVISQDFTRLVLGEEGKEPQFLPCDWEEVEGMPTGVVRAEKRIVAVSLQAALTASGHAAPFLIYVKAPSMPAGKQAKIKLEGVGSSANPHEFAYLIIDDKRKVAVVLLNDVAHENGSQHPSFTAGMRLRCCFHTLRAYGRRSG